MIDSLSNHTNKYIFLFTDKSGRFTQNKCIPMKSGIMNRPQTRAQIVDLLGKLSNIDEMKMVLDN